MSALAVRVQPKPVNKPRLVKAPRKNPPKKSAKTLIIGLFVFMLAMSAFVHLLQRVKTVEVGYQLTKNRKTLSILQEENNKLEAQIAELSAPGRLEAYARGKLKMTEPSVLTYIQSIDVSAKLPASADQPLD